MTMQFCETCKYYVLDHDNDGMTCECPKMIFGYSQVLPGPDEVLIESDEGWGMVPGPKFGCIHHLPQDHRDMLKAGLAELSDRQTLMFRLMYGQPRDSRHRTPDVIEKIKNTPVTIVVDQMPDYELDRALRQVMNTLKTGLEE